MPNVTKCNKMSLAVRSNDSHDDPDHRSSNFYLGLLLVMLFLCTLPVGYVIGIKPPSKHCGPFSGRQRFYSIITDWLNTNLPEWAVNILNVLGSPGIIIPGLVLLT